MKRLLLLLFLFVGCGDDTQPTADASTPDSAAAADGEAASEAPAIRMPAVRPHTPVRR